MPAAYCWFDSNLQSSPYFGHATKEGEEANFDRLGRLQPSPQAAAKAPRAELEELVEGERCAILNQRCTIGGVEFEANSQANSQEFREENLEFRKI